MATVPNSLDPAAARGTPATGTAWNFYSPLLAFPMVKVRQPGGVVATETDQTKVVPYLAKSYTVSNDAKTITFKLRPGTKFSNGDPLTAQSVLASFERAKAIGATAAFFVNFGNQPDLTVKWDAPDAMTFRVTMSRPEPLSLKYLAQPPTGIVNVKQVNDNGGDQPGKPNQWILTHSAGSGPYVIDDVKPGISVSISANPRYTLGPKARSKNVIINFVTDPATLLLQARNGEADSTWGLSKQAVKSLQGNPNVNIMRIKANTTEFMALPNTEPPFDNKVFRQGLSHAIPYRYIVGAITAGYGRLFYGPFSPATPGFNAKLAQVPKYDVDLAKKLIAQSGVKLPVSTDLMVVQGNADEAAIATFVQDALSKVGVNLRVNIVPAAVYASSQGIYQYGKNKIPLLRQDGPAVNDPVYQMDYDQKCWAYSNSSGYCDERTDKLLLKLHDNTTAAERKKMLDTATKYWVENAPKIQFFAMDYTEVLHKDVKYWNYFMYLGPSGIAAWGRK